MRSANLYIPADVKHRELYAKVLLAARASHRGFNVFLGRKKELDELAVGMPAGVYYGLGTAKNFAAQYRALSDRGHLVVVNDEEGLVTFANDMYLDLRVSPETLASVDLIFTWGEENTRVLAAGCPESAAKLRTSGNPRFDLLKTPHSRIYDREVSEIRHQYRKYLLICTSFGSCNHYIKGHDYAQELVDKKILETETSIESYRRFLRLKIAAWEAFLSAIPMVARAYPDTDVVVRPHPSENHDAYRQVAAGLPNVYVDQRFSIHPWLLASSAIVHHYCTSAVEAYGAGIPGFALRPLSDASIETNIPYSCSHECSSPEKLVEALKPTLVDSPTDRRAPASAVDYSNYVKNLKRLFAADAIVEEIWTKVREMETAEPADSANVNALPPLRRSFTGSLRQTVRPFLHRRSKTSQYLSHKFDRLTVDEVKRVLDVFTEPHANRYHCERSGRQVVRIWYEASGVHA